jgi:hypothetical protein
VRNEVD